MKEKKNLWSYTILALLWIQSSGTAFSAAPSGPQKLLLFTIYRQNYKPWKHLRYHLRVKQNCQVDFSNPLDIYYVKNENGEVIPMSAQSREYFGAEKVMIDAPNNQVTFQIKAMAEMREREEKWKGGKEIKVLLSTESKGQCRAKALLSYQGRPLKLERLTLHFNKFWGMILSLNWARIAGWLPEGKKMIYCIAGSCPGSE